MMGGENQCVFLAPNVLSNNIKKEEPNGLIRQAEALI